MRAEPDIIVTEGRSLDYGDDPHKPGGSSGRNARGLTHDRSPVRPEDKLGLVLIVAATAQGDVLDGGRTLFRVRLDVVQLQERALRASVSRRRDEGTAVPIASPDRASDLVRDMPRP